MISLIMLVWFGMSNILYQVKRFVHILILLDCHITYLQFITILQMIPRELLQTLNLNNSKDVKMAENLWKMLDQMADSNPADYEKFISKNLKEGMDDMKEEKQKKEQPLKIVPNVGFLLELRGMLKYAEQDKKSEMFKVADQKESWEKVSQKFKKEMEIYLNVCYSDRVLLPLDKDNNEITELSAASMSKIASIPYSLQTPVLKNNIVYFLLVLNNEVFNVLKQINLTYLINMVCSLVQQRIKTDRNPLFLLYNHRQYPDKKVFYELVKESIKMNKQTPFKFQGLSKPQKILLEPGADKQQSFDVNKGKPKSKEQIKFKQTKTEDIKLPDIKFETNPPTKQQPKEEKLAPPKKVFVEEISENTQVDTKIPYNLVKDEKEFRVEFLVPGISSMKELELDVNTRCIKVYIPNSKSTRKIELDRAINVQFVRAKYSKKEHKLNVVLPFL